jgi:hypothetical protein
LEDFLNSYRTITSLPPYFCQNFFDNYNEDTVLIFPDNIKTIGYKAFEKAEFGYRIADDVELQQGALIAAKNKS